MTEKQRDWLYALSFALVAIALVFMLRDSHQPPPNMDCGAGMMAHNDRGWVCVPEDAE